MSLVYKSMFGIQVMHEYFLTRYNGDTVFEELLQPQRSAFVAEEFSKDHDAINSFLAFDFPQTLKETYSSSGLKLLPTYSGCKVVARVLASIQPDLSTRYKTAVQLPPNVDIFICMIRRNNMIDSVTNSRLRRPYSSTYFFSNDNIIGSKTFPFLTNPVPSLTPGYAYEQGELYADSGTINSFYRDGGDKAEAVSGQHFANESDRVLCKESFVYRIPNTLSVTEITFRLTDKNGTLVHEITGGSAEVSLDFSGKVKPVHTATNIEDALYDLAVVADNGYAANHKLIFGSDLLEEKPWAVVHIKLNAANIQYNIVDGTGSLITRKDSMGVIQPAPVFEIPVKSRYVFWRFINNRGKELNVSAPLADYLKKEGSVLISKRPRALSRHFFLLRNDALTATTYLPNPMQEVSTPIGDGRTGIDIRVPESEMFPVTP